MIMSASSEASEAVAPPRPSRFGPELSGPTHDVAVDGEIMQTIFKNLKCH